MKLTSSVGTIFLSIFLILTGLGLFGIAIPSVLTGLAAIIAAILLLIGR
jgi:hypothetical protein